MRLYLEKYLSVYGLRLILLLTFITSLVCNLWCQQSDSLVQAMHKRKGVEAYFSTPSSEINLRYIYGIPAVISQDDNLNNYSLSGQFGMDLIKIPFLLKGTYNSYNSFSGLNSYFTLELDTDELKKRKELLKQGLIDSVQAQKSKIEKRIFDLKSSILFRVDEIENYRKKLNVLENYRDNEISYQEYLNKYSGLEKYTLNNIDADTLYVGTPLSSFSNPLRTTLSNPIDSVQFGERITSDRKAHYEAYIESFKDSLINTQHKLFTNISETEARIEEYQEMLKEVEAKKKYLENQISIIEQYGEMIDIENAKDASFLRKNLLQIIQNAEKLELGMARPNNSRFLIRGLPLLGLHLESQLEDIYYISVSGGRIYNPRIRGYSDLEATTGFFQTIGFPQESIQYNGLQLKGGIGKPDESHIHLGWLRAKSSNLPLTEKHSVFELDSRFNYKGIRLYAVGAISSNKYNGKSSKDEVRGRNSDSENLKNRMALEGNIKVPIRKTGTRINAKTSYYGSEFFSPGLGYQRAGLFTYRVEATQKVFRKTRASVFYSQETDGKLIDLLTYNVFQLWGVELNQQIGRHIEVFGQYSPLQQQIILNREIESSEGSFITEVDSILNERELTESFIINSGINWTQRFGETSISLMGFFQHYDMDGEGFEEKYNFYSGTAIINFQSKWVFIGSCNHLKPLLSSSSFEDRLTSSINLSMTHSKTVAFNAGGAFLNEGGKTSFGYSAGVDLQLYSNLKASVRGEKMVEDYFMGNFLMENYNKLEKPYRISTSLTWTL